MIPKDFITEWRRQAPWQMDSQVEQDLMISRALVELYQQPEVAKAAAFRGGTALYKLHLKPARYSEDIDLVQVAPGPIGPLMSAIRRALDGWLGEPRRDLKEGRVVLQYRVVSQDQPPLPLRLKVEINSREHFSLLGLKTLPFEVNSRWFSGAAEISTYALEELLGTKLRALYQRRKGRDLFDLWTACQSGDPDLAVVVRCFQEYLARDGLAVSRAELEANLVAKMANPAFRADISPLLVPNTTWSMDQAAQLVMAKLASRLPGEPWKGA